jgi:hypothetical protein
VTTGVVVSSILLSANDLLRVVKLTVLSGADFVADGGLQIDVDSTGHMLAGASLAEEGVERIISDSNTFVVGHQTIRRDTVLEAVKLPAAVTGLNTGLTQMDGDTFCTNTNHSGSKR